jgi:hypothetical protein
MTVCLSLIKSGLNLTVPQYRDYSQWVANIVGGSGNLDGQQSSHETNHSFNIQVPLIPKGAVLNWPFGGKLFSAGAVMMIQIANRFPIATNKCAQISPGIRLGIQDFNLRDFVGKRGPIHFNADTICMGRSTIVSDNIDLHENSMTRGGQMFWTEATRTRQFVKAHKSINELPSYHVGNLGKREHRRRLALNFSNKPIQRVGNRNRWFLSIPGYLEIPNPA